MCGAQGNITVCKTICDEEVVISTNATEDTNGGNEHVHTNQVCEPNDIKMEVNYAKKKI